MPFIDFLFVQAQEGSTEGLNEAAEEGSTEGLNEAAEEGATMGLIEAAKLKPTMSLNEAREHLKGVVSYLRQQDTYLINKYGPKARVGTARYVSTHLYAATKSIVVP